MLRSPNRATLFRIGTIFAVLSSVVYSKNASAEDAQALVVVIDAADQDSVKRIGRQHVRVEVLFAEESEAETGDYAACNKRVQGLLEFRLLLRGEKQCVTQKFWQERMSAANPKARVHRFLSRGLLPKSNTEFNARKTSITHLHQRSQRSGNTWRQT